MPSDFIPELPSALAVDVRRRRRKALGERHRLEVHQLRRDRGWFRRLLGRRPGPVRVASAARLSAARGEFRQVPSHG
jgi:hypothetical protein